MRKTLTNLTFIFLLLLTPTLVAAKSDWGTWIYGDATWNHRKWSFAGALEYRMNQNISKPELYSFGLYSKYRCSKLVRLSYGYEFYANDDGKQNIYIDHRMMLQVELFFKLNNFHFSNRNSLLDDFKRIQHPNWGMRNRLNIIYPIKKIEPFVYGEFYFNFDNDAVTHQKSRYVGGVNYKFNRKNAISLYYLVEHKPRKSSIYHVIGVSYALTLN